MIETFLTAFTVYFVVIDALGSTPIYLAVSGHLTRSRKLRTAVEGTLAASFIMFFFAICGKYIIAYLNLTEAAFQIAGGIILFLLAVEMLTARRQQRKHEHSTGPVEDGDTDSIAIYPLATPLLAGPGAIVSVIVVNSSMAGEPEMILLGHAALAAALFVTGIVLCLGVLAETWLNARITTVFSRITSLVLATLAMQYVINGLVDLGVIAQSAVY